MSNSSDHHAAYILAEREHRVEIDGVTYAPIAGTFAIGPEAGGEPVYRRCDLARAGS